MKLQAILARSRMKAAALVQRQGAGLGQQSLSSEPFQLRPSYTSLKNHTQYSLHTDYTWDETECHKEPKQPFFVHPSVTKSITFGKKSSTCSPGGRHTASTTDISKLKNIKPGFQVCFPSQPPSLHKHSRSSRFAVGKLMVPATFPESPSSSSILSSREQHTMHNRKTSPFTQYSQALNRLSHWTMWEQGFTDQLTLLSKWFLISLSCTPSQLSGNKGKII